MRQTLTLFLLLCLTAAAQELPAEPLEKLHAMIRSDGVETPWAQIPWMTSVSDARERAAKEGKPLLLWAAGGGGHPLALC